MSHFSSVGLRNMSAEAAIAADVSWWCSSRRHPRPLHNLLECDHSSFTSGDSAIKVFQGQSNRPDILLCNAGVTGMDNSLVKDGKEYQLGVNQMAYALMIKMLLPTLQSTARYVGNPRVVFEFPIAFVHMLSGCIHLTSSRRLKPIMLLGVAFVIIRKRWQTELAQRYLDITTVFSVYPSVIWTCLGTSSGVC